ncbi:MAG: DegV family protein [Dehalococcoidales bacterium]|nr:DegV family protein [Dehalococcoidales bacterium]
MKEVMVITDSLGGLSSEQAREYDVMVVPYHTIFDGKDYPDNSIDREKLFTRLESYQDLPTHSACTTGEILKAYKRASQSVKSMLFVALSSSMSADYNAAIQAKESASKELPDIAIEVVDSRSVISGELLVVLAAARAANEGKSLSDVARIARQVAQKVTLINVPETLFFFERSGRSGGEPNIAKAPMPIYPLLEMDASSGGVGKFISKNRTKGKALDALVEIVREKCGNRKICADISYSSDLKEAEALKRKLVSQFEFSALHITPHSSVACVVTGPRCVSLAFYGED